MIARAIDRSLDKRGEVERLTGERQITGLNPRNVEQIARQLSELIRRFLQHEQHPSQALLVQFAPRQAAQEQLRRAFECGDGRFQLMRGDCQEFIPGFNCRLSPFHALAECPLQPLLLGDIGNDPQTGGLLLHPGNRTRLDEVPAAGRFVAPGLG